MHKTIFTQKCLTHQTLLLSLTVGNGHIGNTPLWLFGFLY